jgi:fructose-1,6-bisphosphatase/inositol monophosphatase family enzyme
VIDLRAEANFIENLTRKFGADQIYVVGEESLFEGLDLGNKEQICLLVDMIDGTDLLERRMSNWCSAIIVFDPQKPEILGAYVYLAEEGLLYFATKNEKRAYKAELELGEGTDEEGQQAIGPIIHPPTPLPVLKKDVTIENASVCIYGQKSSGVLRLLSLNDNKAFTSKLKELGMMEKAYREAKSAEEVRFRFYNLAGNPMMVRLLEGYFDVVAEPKGQHPHDMAAGAFIAAQGGATLLDENGDLLELSAIANALLRPADRNVSYILASNEILANEMANILKP